MIFLYLYSVLHLNALNNGLPERIRILQFVSEIVVMPTSLRLFAFRMLHLIFVKLHLSKTIALKSSETVAVLLIR